MAEEGKEGVQAEDIAAAVGGMSLSDETAPETQPASETQPALTPPRKTPDESSKPGSSGRTRLTREEREALKKNPTPKDSKEYKEERDAAVSKLAQVNECTRSSLDYLF